MSENPLLNMPEPPRSPHWHTVEKEHRMIEPTCAICGGSDRIQVHHTSPPFEYCFAIGRLDLELDERNLFSICEGDVNDHHILVGHLDDFKSWNPDFHTNHHRWKGMSKEQIKADKMWQALHESKPPHARDMTHEQLAALRKMVDKLLPPDPAVLKRFNITIHPFQ